MKEEAVAIRPTVTSGVALTSSAACKLQFVWEIAASAQGSTQLLKGTGGESEDGQVVVATLSDSSGGPGEFSCKWTIVWCFVCSSCGWPNCGRRGRKIQVIGK